MFEICFPHNLCRSKHIRNDLILNKGGPHIDYEIRTGSGYNYLIVYSKGYFKNGLLSNIARRSIDMSLLQCIRIVQEREII